MHGVLVEPRSIQASSLSWFYSLSPCAYAYNRYNPSCLKLYLKISFRAQSHTHIHVWRWEPASYKNNHIVQYPTTITHRCRKPTFRYPLPVSWYIFSVHESKTLILSALVVGRRATLAWRCVLWCVMTYLERPRGYLSCRVSDAAGADVGCQGG